VCRVLNAYRLLEEEFYLVGLESLYNKIIELLDQDFHCEEIDGEDKAEEEQGARREGTQRFLDNPSAPSPDAIPMRLEGTDELTAVAKMFEEGSAFPMDLSKAVLLYTEAAWRGCDAALCSLGLLFYSGDWPRELISIRDHLRMEKKQREENERKERGGDQVEEVKEDEAKIEEDDRAFMLAYKTRGLRLYEEAAAMGNIAAQFNLAWRYNRGVDYTQDKQKALRLYHLASEGGSCVAICGLAELFEQGDSGAPRKDERRAYELWSQAASLSHPIGCFRLGRMYDMVLFL